jgi:ankyrin repeat protein/beta-lactamase regulating signal transducer with metallopeptidase domain
MTHIINDVLIDLNNIGRIFCDYAAGVFVQSALLVILLLVVDLLLRKRVRAVFRYCVWLLVLVKLVLPPMLSLPTGIGYWVGDHIPAAFPTSVRAFDVARLERASPSAEMPHVRPSRDIAENEPSIMLADSALTPLTWQAVLFVLWLVGVFAFLVVLVQRIKFVRGLIAASSPAKKELLGLLEQCRGQIGVSLDIGLRVSEAIPSPAVCGFFRPTVLIPATLVEKLSPEGLRATLIHELAHIKRGDLWVNSVQTFLQVIYFYNPFVWFANSIIRRICEEAVDETVLVTLGGQAKNYSNTLIDIGEMAFWRADLGLRLVGVAESKKALKWRIKHMLTRPIPKSSKLGALGIIVIFTIAAVLLPMAKAQKLSENNEPAVTVNEGKPTKSLHQASADGDIEQVKLHLSQGADVNAKDRRGRTALHRAAYEGHADVVKLLIDRSADVNAKDKWGNTPLGLTTIYGYRDVAELLIARGADVNAKDEDDLTPLHWAAWHGRKNIVELLIAKEADVNSKDKDGKTPADHAIKGKWPFQSKILKLLMAKGASVSTLQGIYLAAYLGDLSKIKNYINQDKDVNAKDRNGKTLLHIAAMSGQKEVIEFLLSRGADVNAKDGDGNTALDHAAWNRHRDMAKLLLAKGATRTFPKGWWPSGANPKSYEMRLDTSEKHSGKASAHIKFTGDKPAGFGTLMQSFKADSFRGERVQMSAWLKTERPGRAQLWMRVDGTNRMLGLTNMGDRPVRGTTNWKEYNVTLDVPENAMSIAFGALFLGRGQAWVDDFEFEVVGTDVPSTNMLTPGQINQEWPELAQPSREYPRKPVNLAFEDVDDVKTKDDQGVNTEGNKG